MTSSTDARRGASSSPRGTSNGTCASASVRLARTMRCATVGSGTRNARAISSVVRPPSRRSVSATRASVDSTGWQEVNTSRSRSSPTSSSSARVVGGASATSSSRPSSCVLALERRAAAQRVDRAVLGGGHQPGARVVRDARLAATAPARRRARPARAPRRAPTSRTIRASPAISRADSIRQTASIVRWVAVTGALARPTPPGPPGRGPPSRRPAGPRSRRPR